jgi:hypothetical protein
MESVEVIEPGRSSILTLMLKQILDRNLQDPRKARLMQGRVFTVRVRARGMQTTLFFEADRVRAEDGTHGRPELEIAGDMPALLSIVLGASPLRALLAGKMRVRPRRLKGWFYGARLMRMMRLGASPGGLGPPGRRGREKGEIP